jgi:hypothetical protein
VLDFPVWAMIAEVPMRSPLSSTMLARQTCFESSGGAAAISFNRCRSAEERVKVIPSRITPDSAISDPLGIHVRTLSSRSIH